jgi:hypothetical protein
MAPAEAERYDRSPETATSEVKVGSDALGRPRASPDSKNRSRTSAGACPYPTPPNATKSEEILGYEEMRACGYDTPSLAMGRIVDRARHEAAELIPVIEEAFRGVSRPQITLHVARGIDDEWNLSEERHAELRAMDPEEDWEEVDGEHASGFWEYFPFSDDEGWRFYLPVFMRHFLRNFPDSDYDNVSDACEKKTHMGLLNDSQLECVDRFLALCHKYVTPDGAIRTD